MPNPHCLISFFVVKSILKIHRMKFYMTIILALVCLSANAQKKKPLFTAPLGVQAYSFRNTFPIDPAKVLDTIKMMGFKEVEGVGSGVSEVEFKKMCDARGLKIPSTGAGYDDLKDPGAIVQKAKTLGSKYVMTAWIPHQGEFTIEDAKKAVNDFNAAGKVLAENGITFCYHTHGYEFYPYEDGTLMDYIIKNTNPKYVSYEMDIFWVQFGGGDPVALLNKYGDRWKLMHLKDLRKGTTKDLTGGTSTDNDVVIGTGELDIPAILKAAKKAGVKHYFIEDESSAVSKQIPESIKYLKSLNE
jgi:sugar phosphate isomerase/epimerase